MKWFVYGLLPFSLKHFHSLGGFFQGFHRTSYVPIGFIDQSLQLLHPMDLLFVATENRFLEGMEDVWTTRWEGIMNSGNLVIKLIVSTRGFHNHGSTIRDYKSGLRPRRRVLRARTILSYKRVARRTGLPTARSGGPHTGRGCEHGGVVRRDRTRSSTSPIVLQIFQTEGTCRSLRPFCGLRRWPTR